MTRISLNKILLLTSVLIFATLVFTLFFFAGDRSANAEETKEKSNSEVLKITTPVIPKNVLFSGEKAPLDDMDVRESLDRELLVNTYWHSSTILMMKRANRWFPVIEPILKKNKIPDDFKYLALTESGFTKVVSPKGAAGFWQFLEKTAKEYGLEVNDEIDERYNVEKSTEAACRYFNESFETYQNWTLVAASYNAGNRRISEALEKQKADNYYDLYLNEETSRYIYRILAIKILYEDRFSYGFQLNNEDLYPPFTTKNVEVSSTIEDLNAFAQEHGMNYKTLKELNPWLRTGSLPNSSGRVYNIKVISK